MESKTILTDLLGTMEDKISAIPDYSPQQASNLFNWIFSHDDPFYFKENGSDLFSYKALIELQNHKKLNQYQQKKVLKTLISNIPNKFSKKDCFWDVMESFGFNNDNQDVLSFCFPLLCSFLCESGTQDNWGAFILCIERCVQNLPKHIVVDFLKTNTYRDNYLLHEKISTIRCFDKFQKTYLPIFRSQVEKLSLGELHFLSINIGDREHQKIIDNIISIKSLKNSL